MFNYIHVDNYLLYEMSNHIHVDVIIYDIKISNHILMDIIMYDIKCPIISTYI